MVAFLASGRLLQSKKALYRCRSFMCPSMGLPGFWLAIPASMYPIRFCRKFSSVDILGEYSRPGGGLCGQSVELFGHGEALLDPTCKLPFAQHVHQFDANQSGLRRVKRFEP